MRCLWVNMSRGSYEFSTHKHFNASLEIFISSYGILTFTFSLIKFFLYQNPIPFYGVPIQLQGWNVHHGSRTTGKLKNNESSLLLLLLVQLTGLKSGFSVKTSKFSLFSRDVITETRKNCFEPLAGPQRTFNLCIQCNQTSVFIQKFVF